MVILSHERAPYSLILASRRSIHAIFPSEASLARLSNKQSRSKSERITAKRALNVITGRSKSRSTRGRSTITSSNRSKLSSMPSSNRSRSNSILEQLPIIPQTSQRLTHFTIPTLSIIAQVLQSHPSASNLLRKLLIHTHRKQSLIIRALMLQAPVRNVPLDLIIHK